MFLPFRCLGSATLLASFLLAGTALQAQTGDMSADLATAAKPSMDQTWWKHAVVDELYPRSFGDSNGDGIGDLNGITEHLGYLQKLGVDAIWIAPMFPSPQVDFGYDISDYENVDPQYGTMADFDHMQAAAQQHHIRIILDFVLNHTSDKHKWFLESASSRTNPKADWYMWNDGIPADSAGVTDYQRKYEHDGPKGKVVPPNNWISGFGGSAWEWVPARQQYYYHKFYIQQPDLNWRNPAVEKAMFDTMRFWLDRGVAGFRLDAVPTLFEDPQNRNEELTGSINAQGDPATKGEYTDNLPEVHDVIRRMSAMVRKYPGDRVLIGETYLPNTAALDKWYGGAAHDELQLPMDMLVGFGQRKAGEPLSVPYFRQYITEAETQLNGSQPLFVFDNHDNPRSMTRFGDGTHDVEIAKVIATMLFTARDTAMTYYGAAIGMPTTEPTRKEDVKDPIGITGWPKEKGRDGERTPMQWTPGPQAGFSTNANTWLPVAPDYKTVNVQTESSDPNSLLNWYTKLIGLRRQNPSMHNGGIVMINRDDQDVLAWVRTAPAGAKPVVVAMNMSGEPKTVTLNVGDAGIKSGKARTLAASNASLNGITGFTSVTLPPYSSWVASIE